MDTTLHRQPGRFRHYSLLISRVGHLFQFNEYSKIYPKSIYIFPLPPYPLLFHSILLIPFYHFHYFHYPLLLMLSSPTRPPAPAPPLSSQPRTPFHQPFYIPSHPTLLIPPLPSPPITSHISNPPTTHLHHHHSIQHITPNPITHPTYRSSIVPTQRTSKMKTSTAPINNHEHELAPPVMQESKHRGAWSVVLGRKYEGDIVI